MTVMDQPEALRAELAAMIAEHRLLDEEVTALARRPGPPSLELQRLKRRKLALKDRIVALQDILTPDIIA